MSRAATEPYSRLYHKLAREYPAIYADDAAFAAFGRLLMVADATWPMRPPLPRTVRPRALRLLVDAGLVLLDGADYTIRGLDAERARRRDAGRTGAAVRWDSDRSTDGNANALPVRERDETSREIPPPPAERGRREDGTNPRATGTAPRQTGSAPRQNGHAPRQERERIKRDPTPIYEILRRNNAAGREP